MSTNSSAASVFGNWLSLNRDERLTKDDHIVNEVQEHTWLLGEMMRGRSTMEVVRGGKFISERIKLRDQGNFRTYKPGQKRTPKRKPTLETINWDWRFMENDLPYTDVELELGEGDEYTRYQSFRRSNMQELWTDHLMGMEQLLTAQPDAALMEGLGIQPGQMVSLFAYIWEHSDGHPPGWTTVAGLNPADHELWNNQVSNYDSADIDHPNNGIFAAFDEMMLLLRFDRPPNGKTYFEDDSLRKLKILANLDGVNLFSQLLRDGNDQFRAGPQDPSYMAPQFKGVPLTWISRLDTEPLDINSSNAYTNQPWPAGKPRYVFVNCKYIYPVFHPGHFMQVVGPIRGGIDQRDAEALFLESWANLVAKSRQRSGIVAPTL